MDLWDMTRKIAKNVIDDGMRAVHDRVIDMTEDTTKERTGGKRKYGGKTIEEWDREWIDIGMLKSANLTPYNHCVGLYRHVVRGTTKYVGRAIELHNGGFRKRLSDYRRESDSARKHTSGRIIHEHLDEIRTYILVVGEREQDIAVTKSLEGRFIEKYHPEWNKMLNI